MIPSSPSESIDAVATSAAPEVPRPEVAKACAESGARSNHRIDLSNLDSTPIWIDPVELSAACQPESMRHAG